MTTINPKALEAARRCISDNLDLALGPKHGIPAHELADLTIAAYKQAKPQADVCNLCGLRNQEHGYDGDLCPGFKANNKVRSDLAENLRLHCARLAATDMRLSLIEWNSIADNMLACADALEAKSAEIARLQGEVERLKELADEHDRETMDMRYQRGAAERRAEAEKERADKAEDQLARIDPILAALNEWLSAPRSAESDRAFFTKIAAHPAGEDRLMKEE